MDQLLPGMIEAMDDGVGLALGALEYAVSHNSARGLL